MTEKIELTTEVLNCDYFNRNRGFNCYKGKNCTEVPDCYYRQLKRLEQECKDFEILAKSLYKRIEELEKENEALAFRERLYKTGYKASEQENKELKERFEKRGELMCNCAKQRENYRSALEEIRELVEKSIKISYNLEVNSMLYDIKDKINEVLQCG